MDLFNITSKAEDRAPLSRHNEGSNFVTNDDGTPLKVYRGEHGSNGITLETRLGSISFGTREAAYLYATDPNMQGDNAESPRVIEAFLTIRKPVVSDIDDPFVDLRTISQAIGTEKAITIALEQAESIEETGNWIDNFADKYESVADLVREDPGAIDELYLDAFRIFDVHRYVQWFEDEGFDGAIHGGNGETVLEPEYKVFSRDQVQIVTVKMLNEPDVNFNSLRTVEPSERLIEKEEHDVPMFAAAKSREYIENFLSSAAESTEVAEFASWLKGSKIVDASGVPRTLYHGTGSNIERFDSSLAIPGLDKNKNGAFWFSTAPEVASRFAGHQDGTVVGGVRLGHSNVVPVYVSIKNPYVDTFGKYARGGGLVRSEIDALKDEGYDGIIWPQSDFDLPDTTDQGPVQGYYRNRHGEVWCDTEEGYPDQVAAFDAEQVRFAVPYRPLVASALQLLAQTTSERSLPTRKKSVPR
jgi:hypothetical protein